MHTLENESLEPGTHVTEDEVLTAASETGSDTFTAVHEAISGIRFYPISGDYYARVESIMRAVEPSLNGDREKFRQNLLGVVTRNNRYAGWLC